MLRSGMFAIALIGLHVFCQSIVADDADEWRHNWPQWRGPDATGVAPYGDPPTEWSATQHMKWKTEIPGLGKSTPIVWGDRVFVTTAFDTGKVVESATKSEDQPERPFGIKFPNTLFQYIVLCLDRATGKVIWQKTAVEEMPHEGHHGDNSHATPSPVTDGKLLFASFGSRGSFASTWTEIRSGARSWTQQQVYCLE